MLQTLLTLLRATPAVNQGLLAESGGGVFADFSPAHSVSSIAGAFSAQCWWCSHFLCRVPRFFFRTQKQILLTKAIQIFPGVFSQLSPPLTAQGVPYAAFKTLA